LKGGDTIGIGNHGGEWDGKVGSENGTGAAFTQSLDSAGSVDAIGQSIVLGANVQLNNLTFTAMTASSPITAARRIMTTAKAG